MRKFLLLFITICFYSLQVFALNSPQLRCVSVAANGDVTVNWLQPTDMAGFAGYEIYRSTSSTGPYVLVGSSAIPADVSFTHVGAGANTQTYYYYVQAITTSTSHASAILATIDFYLTNPGNGLAVLTWSPPISPLLPTYNTSYDVFREYPAGVWTQINTTNNPRYSDTITICDDIIGYRIELADASGCRNVSRVNRDQFMDKIGPGIPVLDSVSVNFTTSTIEIGWERSNSNDTYAYIIYHQENGVWVPIDTVYGINNTFYRDTHNSPPTGVQSYRIAALDSCMNSSPMSTAQSTMTLTTSYDTCTRKATLNWSPYENMINEVGKYRVYYTVDGGALQYAGETSESTLSYTFSNLIPDKYYCFIVRAINKNNTIRATSIKSCFTFTITENDDFAYVRYVSVVANEYIEVKVFTGGNSVFEKVNLYRSDSATTGFTLLASLKNDGSDNYLFQDKNVKVDRAVYYYQAALENHCGAETVQSNISHNILLSGEVDADTRMNNLEWGEYAEWENGVGRYIVVRKAERSPQFEMIGDTPGLITHYEDDVNDLATLGADFYYYIEAQESGINQFGFTDIARSNRIKLTQPPLVFIPNAFRPEGNDNRIFKPVNSYMSALNYSFIIYSRFGMIVFSTTDPNEGWDGTIKGDLAELGVYVYKLRYTDDQEVLYEQTGTVTLVR